MNVQLFPKNIPYSCKKLDLSYNNLRFIPPTIERLRNLEVLNVSGNRLTSLPFEIGFLPNLKLLELKGTLADGLQF